MLHKNVIIEIKLKQLACISLISDLIISAKRMNRSLELEQIISETSVIRRVYRNLSQKQNY